jgi:hypothetical protein
MLESARARHRVRRRGDPGEADQRSHERAPRGDVHYRFVIGAATLGAD